MKHILQTVKLAYKHGRQYALLLSLIIVSNGFFPPVLVLCTQRIIDSVILIIEEGHSSSRLMIWIAVFVLISVLFNLRELMEQLVGERLIEKYRTELSPLLIENYKNIEYFCYEDEEISSLISRVGSSPENELKRALISILWVPNLFFQLAGYSFLFVQSGWWIYLFMLILSIPTYIFKQKSLKEDESLRIDQSFDKKISNYLSGLITSRQNIKEIRLFGAGSYINDKWYKKEREICEKSIYILKKQQKRNVLVIALEIIFIISGMMLLFISFYRNNITFGLFMALISQFPALLLIITWYAPYAVSSVKNSGNYIKDLSVFFNLPKKTSGLSNLEFEDFTQIVFKNVYFKYPNTDSYVLNCINFTVNKNETIALVGANGSGKSTIIKILLGLYKATSGEILIDGRDINTFSMHERVKLFSAVFQDYFTYELSVQENIGIGNIKNVDNTEMILELSEKIFISDEITRETLNKKIGKTLYEDGIELSGGQQQKSAILRALFAESRIAVLDEPTASLDPVAEERLYRNFLQTKTMKTCIIVSHRLGFAKHTDKILVLSHGKVAESGTHGDLMAMDGIYADMFNKQAKWYIASEVI